MCLKVYTGKIYNKYIYFCQSCVLNNWIYLLGTYSFQTGFM